MSRLTKGPAIALRTTSQFMGRARCAKRILITMGRTAGQSPMWNVFKENRKSFGVRFTTMLMVRSQDAAYASTSVFLQSLDQLFAPGPFHAWNDEGLLRIMDVVSEASGVGHGDIPMRLASPVSVSAWTNFKPSFR